MKVLFIDNFDSFTYNLVDEFAKRRHEVLVYRNDISLERLLAIVEREDPALLVDSAATYDWGRRQLVSFLAPRGFGDVETEALIMVALLGAFGMSRRSATTVEAAAYVIERGLLGR